MKKEEEEYLIKTRRYLHENPEVTPNETDTCRFIEEELRAFGIPYETVKDGGIIGRITGAHPGNTLLFRADVDALPSGEAPRNRKREKTAVSGRKGAAHLCGHDAHTAMLLTAARILNQKRDSLCGEILLVFERGEENYFGIQNIMNALTAYRVNRCFGMHVYAGLESGRFGVISGPCMAGNGVFHVTVKGKGCHGATLELGIDPIQAAISIINALNARIFRLISPFDPIVFSIGRIWGGTCWNVIPEEAGFDGSFRFFDEAAGEKLISEFEKIVEGTGHACGCSVQISMKASPPVVNEENFTALVSKAIQKRIGNECICEVRPWMASESMAYYTKKYPGTFAFLGIADEAEGTGAPHHSPEFDVDEGALTKGTEAFLGIAEEYLGFKE